MKNIFILNDGKVVVAEPGEEVHFNLDDVAMYLVNPQTGDVIMNDGKMWVSKPIPEPEEDTEPVEEQTQEDEEE